MRRLKVPRVSNKRMYILRTRLVKLLSRIFKRRTIEISIFAIAIGLRLTRKKEFSGREFAMKNSCWIWMKLEWILCSFRLFKAEIRISLEGKLSSIKTGFCRYSFSAQIEYKRRTLFFSSIFSYLRLRDMIEKQLSQILRDDRQAIFSDRDYNSGLVILLLTIKSSGPRFFISFSFFGKRAGRL